MLTMQLTSAFFDGAQTYSNAHDPAESESLASYLYKRSSPLFDGLDSADARKRALHSMRYLAGWTGAELEDVSLRYWAFTPDTSGPDVLVTGGQYSKIVEHLADGCDIRLNTVVTRIEEDVDTGARSEETLAYGQKASLSPRTRKHFAVGM